MGKRPYIEGKETGDNRQKKGNEKMAHEVETMAYVGETPWHGLGTNVEEGISPQKILEAAGLDWELQKTPVMTKYQDAETGEEIENIIPDKFSITRTTDGQSMTICGKDWQPTQNKEAFEFFDHFCEVGGARMETAGSLKGGRHVWGLANLNTGFETSPGDKTNGYLLFSLPHFVGSTIKVQTTSVRVVCNNTLSFALSRSDANYKQNHMSNFNFDLAKEAVENARETIAQQGKFMSKLKGVKMGQDDAIQFYRDLITPEALKEVEEELSITDVKAFLETGKGKSSRLGKIVDCYQNGAGADTKSAYGVLQGLTNWCDHASGYRADSRMFSSWFGVNDTLKTKAQKQLLDLAA